MAKREEVLRIFPDNMKNRWEQALENVDRLQEIRMGVNSPVRVLYLGRERFLSPEGVLLRESSGAWRPGERELDDIVRNICRYSMYAFENEIRQGFLTVPGGHRVGMAGQVVVNGAGEIRNITRIRFLNIRISHQVIGAAGEVIPFLYRDNRFLNTLLVSPPGCGKTTLLRDIIRQVSEGNPWGTGRSVGVVDERSEIAGSFQGVPQNSVGIRTDVLDGCPKVQGMMLLLRSMAPSVVAVDEIGGAEDMDAIRQVLRCGSSVLATMHGDSMEDVIRHMEAGGRKEDSFSETISGRMFERYLFLEKKNGQCRIRGILNREGERIFPGRSEKICCG